MRATPVLSQSRQALFVLCAGLLFVTWPAGAGAQTVLSPAPLIPFGERSLSSPEIPDTESGDPSQEAENGEKQFSIPLVLNDCVESQIEYFTTRGRAVFQAWLNRSARYIPLMKKIFREFNLPEDLVYVAMIESGFNPHAQSPKKALGPWQFMKSTAREYGLLSDYWVDERKDPIKSTRAAAAHFKDLYSVFGSWHMALASYNAGMGRMQGAVSKAGSDDFWELRTTRFIRAETQEYVPRCMAAMIIAKDPDAYGFRDPENSPFEFDEVIVDANTDLRRIAEFTGSSYGEIRDLNPELLQPRTPRSKYVLRIPPGTKTAYQRRMAKISRQEQRHQEAKNRARSGGLLFSRITGSVQSPRTVRNAPVPIISPYGVLFGIDPQVPDSARAHAPRPGPVHSRYEKMPLR